ncbi:MAG TPA: glycosyltransferase [Chryseosolibacter sp.]|nr:glycosyltransferase [Chryseosolibacter sp.]
MTILFLSYWGINEGLTESTVLPHVRILAEDCQAKVLLVSIERSNFTTPTLPQNVLHVPLQSKGKKNVILTKIQDFLTFPQAIIKLCRRHQVDLIMCRSSLAGALGYLVWRRTRIPYTVESFEPHAAYMIESGVWGKYDLRYWSQLIFEKVQRKTATWILPVSKQFANHLIKSGTPASKIITMPCCLRVSEFAFSKNDRISQRELLAIPAEAIVGIYAGKFGGIYYEKEAFELFKLSLNHFGKNFYLILLTDYPLNSVAERLREIGFPENRVIVDFVKRKQVPKYLSAADFAYSFYKKTPSKRYLSPIKIGEYWANGLPVLIEDGIGDDAAIVQAEGGGIIYDMMNLKPEFGYLEKSLEIGRENLARQIVRLAIKYRDLQRVNTSYAKILRNCKFG